MYGVPLERVDRYKYLGLLYDEMLKWRLQCESLAAAIRRRAHLARRVFGKATGPSIARARLVFQAYIVSKFVYGAAIWAPTTDNGGLPEHALKVCRALHNALIAITRVPKSTRRILNKKKLRL